MHTHGTQRVLFLSLIATVAFVGLETAIGLRANSLALLSDAAHNFTDAFALVLAAAGLYFQSRPANQFKTYGYHRTGVLAAFLNSVTLVIVSFVLLYEAYQRYAAPETVEESAMIWVAAVGLVLNASIAFGLGGHGHDLNIRAAWIHMAGDAASCLAIIAGGFLIRSTGWLVIDPLLSALIAGAILWSSIGILRDSLNILLEGLPKGLNLTGVADQMKGIVGVLDVHDLHIWSIGSASHALSCHVLIEDMPPSESNVILEAINHMLHERFEIGHTTIQFEHVRCAIPDDCCAQASAHFHPHDHHTH